MTDVRPFDQSLFSLDDVALYSTPPSAYLNWLREGEAFFDGPEWSKILQLGLKARRYYLWDARENTGHALTCFIKGPIRIGYLGFPVCTSVSTHERPYSLKRMVSLICAMPAPPHLLRIPLSAFHQQNLPMANKRRTTVETCIANLQEWCSDATSARRRAISVAKRRCDSMISLGTAPARSIYDLYASVVARHRGILRYTPSYFASVASMQEQLPISFFGLADARGLAGMLLTVRHGDTEYYLHGGTRPDAMTSGVADLLMARAIASARARNAKRFNFLSSPPNQPGLVRFKEKWGGTSKTMTTIDIAPHWIGRMLIRLMP